MSSDDTVRFRTTMRKTETGYEACAFEDLKEGEWFKLYEPDGQCLGEYRVKSSPVPVSPPTGNYSLIVDQRRECK